MALWDQLENFINESIKFSKDAYEKAKELGSLTKLELEVKNLQSQMQKQLTKLGSEVHRLMVDEERGEVSKDDEAVSKILGELQSLNADLLRREAEMDRLRSERRAGGQDQ